MGVAALAIRCGALALCLIFAACSQPPPPGSRGESVGRLNVGVLPDEDPGLLKARYAPLAESIEDRTGLEVQIIVPEDYATLGRLFSEGSVDLAYFGGYTYVRAHENDQAIPLVMRDIDTRFVSYVLVNRNSRARRLSELAGARFSFGSRLSTSGHIMPRHFFVSEGIDAEAFFSQVSYSGAHDRTMDRIASGEVDAGAVNAQIARQWVTRHPEKASRLRVVWQSPLYVDYVWAVQSSTTKRTRRAIKEVFLTLSRDDPAQASFLDAVDAAYFIPAHTQDFEQLAIASRAVEARTGAQP